AEITRRLGLIEAPTIDVHYRLVGPSGAEPIPTPGGAASGIYANRPTLAVFGEGGEPEIGGPPGVTLEGPQGARAGGGPRAGGGRPRARRRPHGQVRRACPRCRRLRPQDRAHDSPEALRPVGEQSARRAHENARAPGCELTWR